MQFPSSLKKKKTDMTTKDIGPRTVILTGVDVKDGVALGALTLGIKNEKFDQFSSVYEYSKWEGSPAVASQELPFKLVDELTCNLNC